MRFGKRFQVDVRDLDAMIDREKRREAADYVEAGQTLSAFKFVVPSSAIGESNDGHNHREEVSGANSRKSRRRLHI
jgi:hypothetical protein